MYQGVVILNKEPGFTSFDAVAVCRRIFGQKAVGHTGTLDPMACGVLPICLGRATKLSDLLTSSEKEYEVEMELGITTDTDDCTGEELSRTDPSQLTEEEVKEALQSYIGTYDQVPPRYAAIKKDGRKLYEYARAGIEVDVPGRPVTIFELTIHSFRSIYDCTSRLINCLDSLDSLSLKFVVGELSDVPLLVGVVFLFLGHFQN